MQNSRVFQQSSLTETSTAGDRVVVYHSQTGSALVLNPTGSRLWQALSEKPHTEESLVEKIAAEHPAQPREVIAKDVADFLKQISAHDLLEVRE